SEWAMPVQASYTGAGAEFDADGELWLVSQNDSNIYQMQFSDYLGGRGVGSQPWVFIDPMAASVWPEDSPLEGTITFDADTDEGELLLGGTYYAVAHFLTNDPENPDVEVTCIFNIGGTCAEVSIDTDEVYEYILAGAPLTTSVAVSNAEGASAMAEWSVDLGGVDWVEAVPSSGSGLLPGDTHTFDLVFNTDQPVGLYETTAIVSWSGGDCADEISFPVTMEVFNPDIVVEDTFYEMTIDVSDPPEGYAISDLISIYNNGSGPLIYEVDIDFQDNRAEALLGDHVKPLTQAFARPANKAAVAKADRQPVSYSLARTAEELNLRPQPLSGTLRTGEVLNNWAPEGTQPWGINWSDNPEEAVWVTNPFAGSPIITAHSPEDGSALDFTLDASGWMGSWVGDMAYDWNHDVFWCVNVGGDNNIYGLDPETGDVLYVVEGEFNFTSARGLAYDNNTDTFYIGSWNYTDIYHVEGIDSDTPGATIRTFPWSGVSGLAFHEGSNMLAVIVNAATEAITLVNAETLEIDSEWAMPVQASYTGAGAEFDADGELWLVSQSDFNIYQMQFSDYLGGRGVGSLPWLSIDPAAASVWPEDSPLEGTITFDAQPEDGGEVLLGGTYYAVAHILSNDPENPDVEVVCIFHVEGAECNPSVEPAEMDIPVWEDAYAEETLMIGNAIDATAYATYTIEIDPAVEWLELSQYEGSVEPGSADDVTLMIMPPSEGGDYSTSLLITFDCFDDGPQTIEVPVTINVSDPAATLDPESIYGAGELGDVVEVNLQVCNVGDGDLPFITAFEFVEDEGDGRVVRDLVAGQDSDARKGDDEAGSGTPVLRGSGGPDYWGYSWVDSDEGNGPVFEWNDISESGTMISGLGDDTNVGPFDLGFDFEYYGQTFNSIRFCTNGFATFTSTLASFGNSCIGETDGPENMLAPFWDDLHVRNGAGYYLADGNTFTLQWTNFGRFSGDGDYTFQIVIKSNGEIYYYYNSMSGILDSATIGIEDQAAAGLEVACNTAYVHDELAVKISAGSWCYTDPEEVYVYAGECADVTVYLDGNEVDGEGQYTGELWLWHNDADLPNPLVVPVVFDVGVQGVFTISGHVGYWNDNLDMAGIEVQMHGDLEDVFMTDDTGMYAMVDIPGGNSYWTEPAIEGYPVEERHPSISAFDAARTAQFSAGSYDLNEYQQLAADVTGDGSISPFDAARILQYSTGIANSSRTGEWTSSPELYEYMPLEMDMFDQDYFAILYGDVTGNWAPDAARVKGQSDRIASAMVTLADAQVAPGEEVVMPLIVSDLTGLDVIALQASLEYDANVLEFVGYRTAGTLTEGFELAESSNLGGYALQAIAGEGTLIEVVFKAVGEIGESSTVTLGGFMLNETVLADLSAEVKVVPQVAVPENFALSQNYPNPFNPVTKITYALPEAANVSLRIYDVTGRLVTTLVDGAHEAGYFNVTWTGTDDLGNAVSSGVYFYVIQAGDFTQTRSMTLLK
ncbi:MAG: T9SS C-terminal target domain-containing protein, partial [Gemmatimonadetes bacterium]